MIQCPMSLILLDKFNTLTSQIVANSELIHVIIGPRQVGKTTVAHYFCKNSNLKYQFFSADGEVSRPKEWLQVLWNQANDENIELLVIDEIQKVENWSETIKKVWDERKRKIYLIILGSSSLEIHKGLSESLAGRFFLHPFMHWSYEESIKLKPMSLEQYLTFGGYPGSYQFINHLYDWLHFIQHSIIEPVIGKDILSLAHVKSPALFRQCFDLVCSYSSREISYTKLLGSLQDKGNTDLIKHYIELFEAAFLIKSLQKFSTKEFKKRSSSPKIISMCPALYSITKDAQLDQDDLGKSFENMIGALLVKFPGKLYYWREGNAEVDYVYQFGKNIHAIEVKWGKSRSTKGLEKFLTHFPNAKTHLVTPENYQRLTIDFLHS